MDNDSIYFNEISDNDWLTIARKRGNEASSHWEHSQKLKAVREENIKMYLLKWVDQLMIDERYQEVFADSRQFTAIRTVLPFLTARLTRPQVVPANSTDIALHFANDFEEVLLRHIERQFGRGKVRLAMQDLLKGERVGALKWRYDRAKNTVVLERVKPESLVIGKRSNLYEEMDYTCHTIERSLGDIIAMFPDKERLILDHYKVSKDDVEALDEVKEIEEEWVWVSVKGESQLSVGWRDGDFLFGKIKDPNWDEGGNNIIEHPMVPFIFFNILNSGDGYIDETSYMEQSKYLQKNYDARGQTITESAKYGGTGTPIFAKAAIAQKDAAKVKFSPVQRVLLDTQDVNKSFTTWKADPIPSYVIEDKYDSRNSIDNIWGSPNIFRGEQSQNNTLGQDVLIRDQAEGRLGDLLDALEDSMARLYQLEAQMMYRYFDEKKFYNYYGNDGKFVSVVISNKDIAQNLGVQIGVKAHSQLPIDRSQQRATLLELAKLNKVGTYTLYKELEIFEDPEGAYKEYVLEQLDPGAHLQEVDQKVFSREANQDLMMVIGGAKPDEREDIDDEYVRFLTQWLESDKYRILQQKKPEAAARVSEFVDGIVAKTERKLNKLEQQPAPDGQPPVPPEVEAILAAREQSGQQPGQPGQPGQQQPGQPGGQQQPAQRPQQPQQGLAPAQMPR